MKKHLLVLISLLLISELVVAQEIRASISAQRVGVGQELSLIVLIIGEKPGSINFPDADGFRKSRQDYGMVRGANGEEHTYAQIYIPEKTGMMRIPAFGVNVGGRTVYMPSHFVEVVAGRTVASVKPSTGTPLPTTSGNNSAPVQPSARYVETSVDASLEFALDKDEAVVGVPVPGTVYLKVKAADRNALHWEEADLLALRGRVRNPAFAQVKTSLPQEVAYRERGADYYKIPLFRALFSAREAGQYTFEGIWLDLEKQWTAPGQPAVYRPWRLTAGRASLKVSALPPAPFPGADKAVGVFRMQAAFAQNPAKTGENTQLLIDISGKGNTAFLPAPTTRLDERNFVVYEPVAKFTPSGDSLLGEGTRRFVYELVPALHGEFDMGTATLHFFNTDANRYDSLQITLPRLKVTGEDKPDLIAARQLDSFYETVLPRAPHDPPLELPWGRYVAIFCMISAIFLAGWAWWKK